MSALFRRKRVVEQSSLSHSSEPEASDADSDIDFFSSTKRKRTKQAAAASSSAGQKNGNSRSRISSSSAAANENGSGRAPGSAPSSSSSSQVVIDLDDSPDASAKLSQSASKPPASEVLIIDLDDDDDRSNVLSSSFIDEMEDSRIKKSLEAIRMSQNRLLSANKTVFIEESVVAPVLHQVNIPSAAERLRKANQSLSASQPSVSNTVATTENPDSPASDDENTLQVRTRLNGRHEHVWRVRAEDSFSKLLQRVSSLYALPPGKLSLVLDGDRISPEQKPGDFDLEAGDEVLVDAATDADLYANAVAAAADKAGR